MNKKIKTIGVLLVYSLSHLQAESKIFTALKNLGLLKNNQVFANQQLSDLNTNAPIHFGTIGISKTAKAYCKPGQRITVVYPSSTQTEDEMTTHSHKIESTPSDAPALIVEQTGDQTSQTLQITIPDNAPVGTIYTITHSEVFSYDEKYGNWLYGDPKNNAIQITVIPR